MDPCVIEKDSLFASGAANVESAPPLVDVVAAGMVPASVSWMYRLY